jgi:tetratricopeptide (TPR) repeat protein
MKERLFMYLILTVLLVLPALSVMAQPDYPWLRSADKLYEKGNYTDAETAYRKALEQNPGASTQYNLGNAIYRQNRIPEAIAEYQKALEGSKDPLVKSNAYYNLGNAHYESQQYQESINAYKESLKLNPNDSDAKKNLMLAMRQLRRQQEQQQPKEQQQQQQEEQEQQQEEQKQDQEQQQQQQQQQQQEKENVNQEEAKEILKAIEREDQRVQEKLKKSAAKTPPPVKDW